MWFKIFVYGTLKTGEPNEHVLKDHRLGQAKFFAKAKTIRKFPLLIASRFNVPYLLFKPGTGHRIFGEVYEVDEAMFTYLDAFENCPTYYSRLEEEVELENGTVIKTWFYTMENYKESLLEKPLMDNYSSKGPHGLEYNEADVEDPEHTHYQEVK